MPFDEEGYAPGYEEFVGTIKDAVSSPATATPGRPLRPSRQVDYHVQKVPEPEDILADADAAPDLATGHPHDALSDTLAVNELAAGDELRQGLKPDPGGSAPGDVRPVHIPAERVDDLVWLQNRLQRITSACAREAARTPDLGDEVWVSSAPTELAYLLKRVLLLEAAKIRTDGVEHLSAELEGDSSAQCFAAEDHIAVLAEEACLGGSCDADLSGAGVAPMVVSASMDYCEIGGDWLAVCDTMLAIVDGKAYSLDTNDHAHWHVPKNEKEYARCPQKHLWRTARELKMDEYSSLDMYELWDREEVKAAGHVIYGSLWAQTIKKDGNGVFGKLNPRWCLMGGNMDREKFKGFCDVMHRSSLKFMACLRVTYNLIDFSFDGKNAFQNTRADGPDDPMCFCEQAPGFVKYGKKGNRQVARIKVGMQGRIDAMSMHAARWVRVYIARGCKRHSVDQRQFIYEHGYFVGTDAPLEDVLTGIQNAMEGTSDEELIRTEPKRPRPTTAQLDDSPPGHKPIGWCTFGVHVDDGFGVASSNRVINYIVDGMRTEYEMVVGPWVKPVGFSVIWGPDKLSIGFECAAVISNAVREHCGDEITISPKHPYPMNIAKLKADPDEDPPAGAPADAFHKAKLEQRRALLGLLLWVADMYGPRARLAANLLCGHMSNPCAAVYRAAKHLLLHLHGHGEPVMYHASPTGSLALSQPTVAPFTKGKMEFGLHAASDSDLGEGRSVSALVIMLGGAAVDSTSQRQHLASPDSTAAEVTAAGTGLTKLVAARQWLQCVRVPQVEPSPYYMDSSSAILLGDSAGAPRRSIWIRRRIDVLTDYAEIGESRYVKIDESDNFSDGFSKPVKHDTFLRHLIYLDGTMAREAYLNYAVD